MLGSLGDQASMEAFRFRAASSRRIEVNAHPGVVADIGTTGEGPNVVTWLVGDDLVLRVFSQGLSPETLIEVARSAEIVVGGSWQALRDEFDPGTCWL